MLFNVTFFVGNKQKTFYSVVGRHCVDAKKTCLPALMLQYGLTKEEAHAVRWSAKQIA